MSIAYSGSARMIKRSIGYLFIVSVLFFYQNSIYAQDADIPAYRGYVNDYANVIDPGAELSITSMARQLEDKTTAQIAVVTLTTTSPSDIAQYTTELFEKWGIGQRDKDNGVLILMSVNDRKVRIETGYGLEGALPDAICKQIIEQLMIPEFKKGGLGKGLLVGVIAVAEFIAKEYNITLTYSEGIQRVPVDRLTLSPRAALLRSVIYLLFFVLFFGLRSGLLFYFILGPTGRRRGGYWHGSGFGGGSGGFGGGFGGFGGGMSGGGGAGGSW
ncbi:MAG: TPM domain-containing protein [Candidatus Omnitrophota bacterium]